MCFKLQHGAVDNASLQKTSLKTRFSALRPWTAAGAHDGLVWSKVEWRECCLAMVSACQRFGLPLPSHDVRNFQSTRPYVCSSEAVPTGYTASVALRSLGYRLCGISDAVGVVRHEVR